MLWQQLVATIVPWGVLTPQSVTTLRPFCRDPLTHRPRQAKTAQAYATQYGAHKALV